MRYEHDHENDIAYFGKVNFRNGMQTFGIKTDDRRRHVYVVGKTGMGKSTLMENMFLSDVYAGHGCCFIDPHGDAAEMLLDFVPSWRINDVVYFNPSDAQNPVGFNILESVDENAKHLVTAGIMGVFKKIWEGVWSARMEYIMNNTIMALLDTPGTTLLSINRMLSDKEYRARIVGNVKDPLVKQFWIQEFGNYQDKFATEAVAPIQNKVGQFTNSSVIRNIIAQAKSSMNFREIMDGQKIFIVNLSKGRVGEDASRLLGGMMITKLQMTAMERVDMPEEERNDFYMYVDEFQNFANESFAGILSEARKYRLNLIMAHQYIAQLTEEVRDAVFGNVGTIITFRVGSPDAAFMEEEWKPRFVPEDLINLPKYSIYLKLMIEGVTSQPFSAYTLPPIARRTGVAQKVIEQSRERYGGNKADIEAKVSEWSGFGEDADIDAKYKEVKDKKKAAKKEKYATHKYDCTRCNKNFGLPVELDRNRPIYCSECKPIIDEERKNRKDKGQKRKVEHQKKDKRVVDRAPKVSDGKVIEKAPAKEMSLSNLSQKKEEPAKKVEEKPREPVKKPEEKAKEPEKKPDEKKEATKPDVKAPSVGDILKKAPQAPLPKPEVKVVEKPTAAKVENKKEEEKPEPEKRREEPRSEDSGDKPKRKRNRRRRSRGGSGGGDERTESRNQTQKPNPSPQLNAKPKQEKEVEKAVQDKGAKTVVAPGQIISFD